MCAAVAMGATSVEAWAPAVAMQSSVAQPRVAVRTPTSSTRKTSYAVRAQPSGVESLAEEQEFEFAEEAQTEADSTTEGANMFALGGVVTAALSGAYMAAKKMRKPDGTKEEQQPIVFNSIKTETEAMDVPQVETLLEVGKWMTANKKTYPQFVALATQGSKKPAQGKITGKYNYSAGKTFENIDAAVKAGVVRGTSPFPEGVDLFGFFNGISEAEAQRYADVEITHGRICMLAALGFLVGEQVEGSSFLFDSQVTGPAVNHFQQVPATFWGLLGASIFVIEANRVQIAWQNPFDAEKLFLLKSDYTPGDYDFDPLNLAKGKDADWLNDMKLKEINNGRVAMVAISGMVAQELVNGLNLIPADEVLEMGKSAALEQMEKTCIGAAEGEAACAKAFEAAERAAVFAANQ